jgi:hypothetical protein
MARGTHEGVLVTRAPRGFSYCDILGTSTRHTRDKVRE